MTHLAVEILSTPACPHAPAVRRRVEELARDEGIEVAITETLLEDVAEAKARRFRGSPTVLVEGRDVETVAAEAPADYGLG